MKVRMNINKVAALKAGNDSHGYLVIDLPADQMTDSQRNFLAHYYNPAGQVYQPSADFYLDSCSSYYTPLRKEILDAWYSFNSSLDVRLLIDALMEADRLQAVKDEAKKAEELEKLEKLVAKAVKAGPDFFIYKATGFSWSTRHGGDWTKDDRVRFLFEQADRMIEAHNAEKKNEEEVAKQKARLAEAAAAADKAVWIVAHGSDRLKRLLAEGIKCDRTYFDERLALERPGWTYEANTPGGAKEIAEASAKSLGLLEECRKVEPDALLVYWQDEHRCDEDCAGDPDCPEYDWEGPVVVADFLGTEIVFGYGK